MPEEHCNLHMCLLPQTQCTNLGEGCCNSNGTIRAAGDVCRCALALGPSICCRNMPSPVSTLRHRGRHAAMPAGAWGNYDLLTSAGSTWQNLPCALRSQRNFSKTFDYARLAYRPQLLASSTVICSPAEPVAVPATPAECQ